MKQYYKKRDIQVQILYGRRDKGPEESQWGLSSESAGKNKRMKLGGGREPDQKGPHTA